MSPSGRRIMRSLKINEISGVDKACQVPAEALLMKRDGSLDKSMGCSYERPQMTTAVNGHTHLLDDIGQGGETSYSRMPGEEYGHTHPWVRGLDGTIKIGASDGHDHALVEESSIIPSTKSDGEPPMSKQDETPAGDSAAVQKSIQDLTTRAERAEAIMKLSAPERAYFDAQKTEGQEAFLKLDSAERTQAVRTAGDASRVIFKSESGQEYRASDDPRLVEMAKQGDADRKVAKASQEALVMAGFAKRASTELAHLPGTDEVRGAILKALEGVPGAPEFLKAAESAAEDAFKRLGATGNTDVTKAEDQLEVLAKQWQTAHPGSTIEKARASVLESPAGAILYAQMSPA